MANALYPKWKQALLEFTANNDLDGQTVKVALVTSGYTYSSSDQYYSSVSASVVGTPQTLGSKTFTDGVFDAADVLYTGARDDMDYRTFPPARVTLPAFAVVNASADLPLTALRASWPSRVALTLDARNLLDEDYESVVGFPGRGRVVMVGVRVE